MSMSGWPVFNVIVDYGAAGNGTTDDTTAVTNAINAAGSGSTPGGIVYFPPGKYKITSVLTVNYNNVILRGAGGDASHDAGTGGGAATTIIYNGTAGGTMISVSSVSGSGNQKITRAGVMGMKLDANGLAGIGLSVTSVGFGIFEKLTFSNFTSRALYVGCVSTLAEAADTQYCRFSDLSFRQVEQGGAATTAVYLDGTSTANTSANLFENISVDHYNGGAMVLNNCDNNHFVGVGLYRVSGGTGIGVELRGSNTGPSAAANTFIRLGTTAGVVARGTGLTYPSSNNLIFSYDEANSDPNPVIESGASLYWHTTNGEFFNSAAIKFAIGDSASSATAARLAIGTESVRIRNGSQDHIRIDDNSGNQWSVSVDGSGTLRFVRAAGSGSISLAAPIIVQFGATISTGAGAPTSAQPVGSLYMRSDGGIGSTLYVSRGSGTWNAVAGV